VTIGPEGGTVELVGQQSVVPISLDIPPTALDAPTTIVVTETDTAPPEGFVDYSPVYRIEPARTEFAVRAEIMVPYGNMTTLINNSLSIYQALDDSSRFERISDSYINAGFLQGSLTRTGLVFAGYPEMDSDPACGGTSQPPPQTSTCTRRPEGPGSRDCPVGVGESTTALIGPEGGQVTLMGQQGKASGVAFSLDIPPTALDEPTEIVVTETDIAPPEGFVDYSPVYRIDPLRTTFAVPVTVLVPWSNSGYTIDPALSIYFARSADAAFVRVADSLGNAGFSKAGLESTGLLFAGYPEP
jgi:hypothetical protein